MFVAWLSISWACKHATVIGYVEIVRVFCFDIFMEIMLNVAMLWLFVFKLCWPCCGLIFRMNSWKYGVWIVISFAKASCLFAYVKSMLNLLGNIYVWCIGYWCCCVILLSNRFFVYCCLFEFALLWLKQESYVLLVHEQVVSLIW